MNHDELKELIGSLRDWSEYDEGKINDVREQASDKLVEQQNEIEKMRGVIFTLAMIDRDMMTEHDEALLEEAIERAKEIYSGNNET